MSWWIFQREVNILQFFDKYYAKLGLPPDADDAAIKSAYRRLAKQYHPDRSRDPGTREKFIEVNQAYEMLLKREAVIQQALRRHYAKKKNKKKEVQHKRDIAEEARRRASRHADMPFDRFARSPIYRTAVVVAGIFDYVAIFTGLVMILAPVGSYFADMTRLAGKGEEPDFHIVPIFIGLSFLYGVWYFKKQD